MASIIILDELTANQIAAGEVVERPVSVVKELVENSLDAGAGKISLDISDGGLKEITVIDDGSGMEEEDLPLAFERHATSKIKSAADLNRITTLGFRGEALPSIAAVSRVTVTTRPHNCISGMRVEIKGGVLMSKGAFGHPAGTTVQVDDLFFNTPARKKAMKNAATEGGLCADLISRLALARPDVSFELRVKGRRVFFAPGTGNIIDAVAAVYGAGQSREMVPVQVKGENFRVRGYAGKPTLHRSSRSYQTIIINGRYVRCPAITTALEEVYRNMIPAGRKPAAVLAVDIDPLLLDVNVHPAKQEVRLLEEERVAGLIAEALKAALSDGFAVPALKKVPPTTMRTWGIEPYKESPVQMPFAFPVAKNTKAMEIPGEAAECRAVYSPSPEKAFPELIPIAQLMPTYILARGSEGLYIIDQHAAHERILFEKFLGRAMSVGSASQALLIPAMIELTPREAEILISEILWLKDAGFIVEHFGGNTFLLRGVPVYFPTGREKDIFIDMLSIFEKPGARLERNDFLARLSTRLACIEAVKSGGKMSIQAMEELLGQLARAEKPLACPHGRPTIVHISYRELDSRFKR
ncbi:MAG: DNA mismatch repair endonuclease MutL [Eubacteriales bacterium]